MGQGSEVCRHEAGVSARGTAMLAFLQFAFKVLDRV
jgi:hypothetical protein